MKKAPLGELELEVLGFVSSRAPSSVRQVAEEYGEPRGLARTTILTVMERLRQKGYLVRSTDQYPQTYSPSQEQSDVLEGIVKEFVEKRLGGSLTPFVAYLANAKGLSPEEVEKLKELVDELEEDQK